MHCVSKIFKIRFSGYAGEVKNISTNQRPVLVFPIDQKKTNLVEDVEILLLVKFHWIPFSGFRGRNLSANQRPGRPFCFSNRSEIKANLLKKVEILLKIRWIFRSVVSGKSKMWKVNDDGQRVIPIVHLILRLRCTKKQNDRRRYAIWITGITSVCIE